MAVVKMWQIKQTLAKGIAYITRPDATQDGTWVSTNTAVIDPGDWRAIARQFAATHERVGVSSQRDGSVLAHHVIQSFKVGERVTTEQAHHLGVQLAERITGGAHEYVIATHLDKGHIHNHIIFNATNMQTGRKFRCQKDTIGRVREISDGLCREAGLTVLPAPARATGRSFGDIYTVLRGQSAKELLRVEIDKAAAKARTWTELENDLELAGIVTSRRGGQNGTLSFRESSMGRAVRDWRLGEAYTEESIMARLARSAVNRISVDESMIISETDKTMTVHVPGTGRRLRMTVATGQVVRHGRSVRIYLPAEDRHMLTDRRGRLAATVTTADLYNWFAKPDLVGIGKQKDAKAGDIAQVRSWHQALDDLHGLRDRINAKSRWMIGADADVEHALSVASERLDRTRIRFQDRLVAAADLMANGDDDGGSLAVLQADLRMTEREIRQLKTDVRALTALTREESRMSIADRIERGAAARRAEEIAQRQRHADQANDRETPGHLTARRAESDAQEVRVTDQSRDRDGGTGRDTGMTLGERIEAEVQRRQAARRTTNIEGRTGRSR
ncbi:relaxase/mobilization nuclease domain-containing protein [Actinomyces sp. 594]|uniref:relaxase/mobilization nuclease domain-containing protein n=1 Tax=Actinomyces sp. 594 TaxID=2057793 RepID=UPI001C5631BD|nr:relaxase/mobilization nuclease domain-containing protein [Actinomyces sp. 594]MBW3069625.1 relaxase/mobilization nuclease domain-containing protein [Actinomyces sp. 594]